MGQSPSLLGILQSSKVSVQQQSECLVTGDGVCEAKPWSARNTAKQQSECSATK